VHRRGRDGAKRDWRARVETRSTARDGTRSASSPLARAARVRVALVVYLLIVVGLVVARKVTR
jgi:hypothetical protein